MQTKLVGNINWILCGINYNIFINTICKPLVADRIKSRAEAAENCGGIVEKIRCDVKGLRNAFSKGRRGTR